MDAFWDLNATRNCPRDQVIHCFKQCRERRNELLEEMQKIQEYEAALVERLKELIGNTADSR